MNYACNVKDNKQKDPRFPNQKNNLQNALMITRNFLHMNSRKYKKLYTIKPHDSVCSYKELANARLELYVKVGSTPHPFKQGLNDLSAQSSHSKVRMVCMLG